MIEGVWEVNVERVITVITSKSVDLVAYYTKSDESNYFLIPGSFTKNGERYYIPFTFTATGSYIVKIMDINGEIKPSYAQIEVIEKTGSQSLADIEAKLDTKPTLSQIENSSVLAKKSDINGLEVLINSLPDLQNIRDEFINIQFGALEIANNQMTIWDKAGIIIAVFDLFDDDGNPTMTAVYKREVV